MEEQGIASQYLQTVKDSMSCIDLLNLGRTPDAYFFDAYKQYVEYRENEETCNGHVSVFIENIPNTTKFNYSQAYDYYEMIDLMYHSDILLTDTSYYDFTIVIVWFKWLDKSEKLVDWNNKLNSLEEKGYRIKRIFLNGDYMDYMHISNPNDLGFDFGFNI